MKRTDLYLDIINNLEDGVYFVDSERKINFWNKAAERITGYTAEEIEGAKCQDSKLNHITADGTPLCTTGCPLFHTIVDGVQRKACVFVRHKSGHRIPIHVNIFPIYEDGKIVGAVEVFTQNSPVVYEDNLIESLTGIAMHDQLTCLPNRRYLETFLDYKLIEFGRFGKPFALLFADIDHFRKFNNEYGHEMGDAILKNIASSVKLSVRKDDLAGRWGGEEFIGIYALSSPKDALVIAEKFRHLVFSTEIPHGDTSLNVSVSIGMTIVQPGDTIDSIIARADKLMYRSKQDGRNRVTSD